MGLADGEGVEGEGGDDEGEREWESVRQWVGCRRRIEEPKDGLARPGSGSVRAVQRSAEELGLRGRAHWVGWLVRRGASKQEATFAAGRWPWPLGLRAASMSAPSDQHCGEGTQAGSDEIMKCARFAAGSGKGAECWFVMRRTGQRCCSLDATRAPISGGQRWARFWSCQSDASRRSSCASGPGA